MVKCDWGSVGRAGIRGLNIEERVLEGQGEQQAGTAGRRRKKKVKSKCARGGWALPMWGGKGVKTTF